MRRISNVLLVGAITTGIVLVGVAGPAGAVQVSNEAELKAAFASDTQIDIEADITLTDCTGGGAVERAAAVTDPVTVNGHGHTVRQTCAENVFIQDGSGLLTVRNLTITGGHATGNGGGIFSAGPLTLTNTTIVGNRADAAGGGIGSQGATTLTHSTVDSNISSGVGGGISLGPDSPGITLTDSTVSNNVGGGIGTPPSEPQVTVTVVNSTITGNTNGPGSLGSGIFSGGSTTLVYATVVRNRAANFSNIDTTTLETFGSVVAEGGTAANCLAPTTVSHGYNFSDDDTCKFTDPTDRQDAGDPQLGPLAANGGPTATLLPQPGSPLIDAIPTASCQADGAAGITSDQRGVTRPQGTGCDIGAVEVEVPVPPVPPSPPPPAPPAPAPPTPVTVTPRFTG
jgi:Right handed beta helix region